MNFQIRNLDRIDPAELEAIRHQARTGALGSVGSRLIVSGPEGPPRRGATPDE
jgi:hypothetical protein